MVISLIGFMGCGKSCIGKELGKQLGYNVIDLDSWIEASQQRSVRRILQRRERSASGKSRHWH